ncbi:GvpL/GvpF family gas vesicle protein [Sporohalobacter salinus]|uniref:GvpL/GvpF family gas vesicle protein n=1 Tax=Sporohalobacter salinus TaxID=1494606 RepID=UPI00195F8FAF|nr:hypothetical protein [Sporohalobacter salinus]
MDKGIYFYGVTLDRNWDDHKIKGMDSNYYLRKIKIEDLNGLISLVPLAEYGHPAIDENIENLSWLKKKSEEHMNILKSAMEYSQIIPMKFCTVFYDEKKIEELLEQNYTRLYEKLEYLSNKEEWSCKLYIDKEKFIEEYKESKQDLDDINGMSKGAAYFKKKKLSNELEEKARKEIYDISDYIYNRIKELGMECQRNDNLGQEITGIEKEMILNTAILIDNKKNEKIINKINKEFNKLNNEHIDIECTGPWPPYNFISTLKIE